MARQVSAVIEVSVIIAAWRAEEHLSRAVASALDQTGVSLEVIVVDDTSPDRTLAIAEGWAERDPRVVVLSLPRNGGPAAARNAGLSAAQGRWACILDADDAMAFDRVARMVAFGEKVLADAVYDDLQPTDPDGAIWGPPYLNACGLSEPVMWRLEEFLAGDQIEPGRPNLGYLKPLLRMDCLRSRGIVYDPTLRNGEDFHLMAAILAAGGRLWVMPEAGYLYTMRSGSISAKLDLGHARALAAADAAFLSRHAASLSPRAVALMRRRLTRLGDLTTVETAMQSLKSGRPGTAIGVLFGRPRAAGLFVRQMRRAAGKRLPSLTGPTHSLP